MDGAAADGRAALQPAFDKDPGLFCREARKGFESQIGAQEIAHWRGNDVVVYPR